MQCELANSDTNRGNASNVCMLRSVTYRPQNKTSDEFHGTRPNHRDKFLPAFYFSRPTQMLSSSLQMTSF